MRADFSVLLVDDSKTQLAHGRSLLQQLGFSRIQLASNGRNALRLMAAGGAPDVLVTDLEMPDIDGVELLRVVAEQRLASAVVIVSSHESAILTSVDDMARQRGLRVLGVVQKPLALTDLRTVLERFESPTDIAEESSPMLALSAADIRRGVASREFILHYQPKVTTTGGVLKGVEALVRWQHPQYGLLSPASFIPLAEESGAIDELTDYLLDLALTQLQAWHAHGLAIAAAVNLSAKSLPRLDLADQIAAATAAVRVEPRFLVLEITETALMADLALSLETLARLRLKGFSLSIDDFGTGFSSLQQLSRVPATEVKIDRSLVHGAAANPTMQALLKNIIDMVKKLQMKSLGEGPDNEADWRLLRDLGCDMAQGYYIARPMPADNLVEWLKHGTKHLRLASGLTGRH